MAKHIGIVAVSAPGAALCYRTICAEGPPIFGRHDHPEITMHNFSLARYMAHIDANDWEAVGRLILESARKLAEAGADFLICPDNTAHQAIDRIIDKSPRPWLPIAAEVGAVAVAHGYRRVGVLGTRYLMEGPVYPAQFSRFKLTHEIPPAAERERINQIIFDELVNERFEETSREYFRKVIARLKDRGCDAVVLACTEIPLLIGDADSPLPILDSTRLLARAALREAAKG